MITSDDKIDDNLQPKSTGVSGGSEMMSSSSENGKQRQKQQSTKVSDDEEEMAISAGENVEKGEVEMPTTEC